jgi:hypothetical protein
MPGVVSLPHGFGHAREGVRLGVATARPGASINDVTDPERLDALTGNAAFSGLPVELARVSRADRLVDREADHARDDAAAGQENERENSDAAFHRS